MKHRLIDRLIILLTVLPLLSTGTAAASLSDGNARMPIVKIGEGFSENADGTVSGIVLSDEEGYPIVYTTDASDPHADSALYTGPLTLAPREPFLGRRSVALETTANFTGISTDGFPQAVVLKAAAVLPDGTVGPVTARTFFPGLDLDTLFPGTAVFSLIVDPFDLLDHETGIMCLGRLYDEWVQTDDCERVRESGNYWEAVGNYTQKGREWERPAFLELFEEGSHRASFSQACGVRLHGALSRMFVQKAFNLYFRDTYGEKLLRYPLIPGASSEADGSAVAGFRSFALDNGGNDCQFNKYRDMFLHEFAADAGLDVSRLGGRPAVLFLNGEYWGVYVVQERYSKRYFADHYGIDGDNIVVFKEAELDEGIEEDYGLYGEYRSFAERDLTDPEVWEAFLRTVDIGSMADYFAYEIYIGNADWTEIKNVSMWRTRQPGHTNEWDDGRWRFNLQDLEYSAGLYGIGDADPLTDHFGLAAENHPVFAAALRSADFRGMLIERLQRLEEVFSPEAVMAKVARYKTAFDPILPMSARRFKTEFEQSTGEYGEMTRDEFHLVRFFDKRAGFIEETVIPEILALP